MDKYRRNTVIPPPEKITKSEKKAQNYNRLSIFVDDESEDDAYYERCCNAEKEEVMTKTKNKMEEVNHRYYEQVKADGYDSTNTSFSTDVRRVSIQPDKGCCNNQDISIYLSRDDDESTIESQLVDERQSDVMKKILCKTFEEKVQLEQICEECRNRRIANRKK